MKISFILGLLFLPIFCSNRSFARSSSNFPSSTRSPVLFSEPPQPSAISRKFLKVSLGKRDPFLALPSSSNCDAIGWLSPTFRISALNRNTFSRFSNLPRLGRDLTTMSLKLIAIVLRSVPFQTRRRQSRSRVSQISRSSRLVPSLLFVWSPYSSCP